MSQETFSSSEMLLLHSVELITSPTMSAVEYFNDVLSTTWVIEHSTRREDGHEWLWEVI